MKVLVTGGAGYVGTVLTSQLLDQGIKVRCLDSLQFGVHPILGLFRNPDFELVRGDIRNKRSLMEALHGVDAIVHLAALVGYPACNNASALAADVNVEGTRLLMALRDRSQPVLMASTGSIYGAIPSGVCDESTPPNPLSLYAQTKSEAECIVQAYEDTLIYRFATAFGLSPRLRLDLLVNDLCYQAVKAKSMIMYESHFQRTFIHVEDIGRAFLHGLDHFDAMRNEIFNCGDHDLNASKLHIAQLIQSHHDFYLHIAETEHDLDARNYEMSYAKISATGFKATVSLTQGIEEMIRAFRFLNVSEKYDNAEAYT